MFRYFKKNSTEDYSKPPDPLMEGGSPGEIAGEEDNHNGEEDDDDHRPVDKTANSKLPVNGQNLADNGHNLPPKLPDVPEKKSGSGCNKSRALDRYSFQRFHGCVRSKREEIYFFAMFAKALCKVEQPI